ncbi:helix-hairpin-helix domain-containing protein [bacterium]|nr:helix-hairpin-helix domain-containing protein [bacterium]
MKLSEKNITLKELKQIPGVGDAIAKDLWDMGIRGIDDLKNKRAEALYMQLCAHQGKQVDRCMLYVFRCAVYFASCQHHQPHLLKWWNWKEQNGEPSEGPPRPDGGS